MTNEIEKYTSQLVDCIRSTSAYQKYKQYQEQLKADPQLWARLDEFIKARYEIFQKDDWYDEIDRVDEAYADLKKKPEINGYLEAELDVCRLLKDVQMQMLGNLDINAPLL